MKLKLHRDCVQSMTPNGVKVGVYVKLEKDLLLGNYEEDGFVSKGTEILLAEMSPSKADKIIKLWNGR
jgi:hypothetical protein